MMPLDQVVEDQIATILDVAEASLNARAAHDAAALAVLAEGGRIECLWCHEPLRDGRAAADPDGRTWQDLSHAFGCAKSPDAEPLIPGVRSHPGRHVPDIVEVDGHRVRIIDHRVEGPRRWTG